jgi:pimeloyl-ACP methyl ester carboxylesterase
MCCALERARPEAAVIRQPSLYIGGAADGLSRLFHPETPSLAARRESQPNLADQVRLENLGHWVQHEAADRLSDTLAALLATL